VVFNKWGKSALDSHPPKPELQICQKSYYIEWTQRRSPFLYNSWHCDVILKFICSQVHLTFP
jgi:hypothetical protein